MSQEAIFIFSISFAILFLISIIFLNIAFNRSLENKTDFWHEYFNLFNKQTK